MNRVHLEHHKMKQRAYCGIVFPPNCELRYDLLEWGMTRLPRCKRCEQNREAAVKRGQT